MKTILVPIDFSKNADNALNYAISLAKKEKAKIILLHAFNIAYLSPDVPIEYFSEHFSAIEQESKKKLDALCLKIRKSGIIKCESIHEEGFTVDIILDAIKKKKVSMVVMGTQGASGIKEVLMGSNTAKVISKASCPVIAVPEKASFDGIKRIVYATDYRSSDIVALKQLVDIAKVFKSWINVVHIADGEYVRENEEKYIEKFAKKVKQKIDYKNISFQLLYSKDIEKKLEQYIKKESVSILAMSTKHRNLIEQLFGRSITKKLAYHTGIPLIAFHYKQKSVVLI